MESLSVVLSYFYHITCFFLCVDLRLMFSLMNRVPDGITPMLHDMEAYIVSQGQADMIAADETINAINVQVVYFHFKITRFFQKTGI